MVRKTVDPKTETEVLTKSARRCCLCVGMNGDWQQKQGQIAHIDHDPSNASEDNLVFLCLPHHDQYDSKTSQSKGITEGEVRKYRQELYGALSEIRKEWLQVPTRMKPRPKGPDFDALIKLAGSLSLSPDRDVEYGHLLTLALKYENPERATRIATMLSLSSERDDAYRKIIEYYLAIEQAEKALELVGKLTLAPDRDKAKLRVIGAMKKPLGNHDHEPSSGEEPEVLAQTLIQDVSNRTVMRMLGAPTRSKLLVFMLAKARHPRSVPLPSIQASIEETKQPLIEALKEVESYGWVVRLDDDIYTMTEDGVQEAYKVVKRYSAIRTS
jgi:hypothetical protein